MLEEESTHWAHRCGASAYDTAAIASVVPTDTARLRHSRRTRNHAGPTLAVALVARCATRRWVLPVGMMIASPLAGMVPYVLLAALPRLCRTAAEPARDLGVVTAA